MKSLIELPSNETVKVNSEAEYTSFQNYKLENGQLSLKPKLSGVVESLRDHFYPGIGNASEGTAVINVQGGDNVAFLAGDIYTGLVLETPDGLRRLDIGENEPDWSTPLGDGIYYMYLHHSDYRSAKLKVIAHLSYPYPEP